MSKASKGVVERERQKLAVQVWERLTKTQRKHLTFDDEGRWTGPNGRRGDPIHAALREAGIIENNRITALGFAVVWHNKAQTTHTLDVAAPAQTQEQIVAPLVDALTKTRQETLLCVYQVPGSMFNLGSSEARMILRLQRDGLVFWNDAYCHYDLTAHGHLAIALLEKKGVKIGHRRAARWKTSTERSPFAEVMTPKVKATLERGMRRVVKTMSDKAKADTPSRAPRSINEAIVRLEALDECLWTVRDTLLKLAPTMPIHDGSQLRELVEDTIDDNLRRYGITPPAETT